MNSGQREPETILERLDLLLRHGREADQQGGDGHLAEGQGMRTLHGEVSESCPGAGTVHGARELRFIDKPKPGSSSPNRYGNDAARCGACGIVVAVVRLVLLGPNTLCHGRRLNRAAIARGTSVRGQNGIRLRPVAMPRWPLPEPAVEGFAAWAAAVVAVGGASQEGEASRRPMRAEQLHLRLQRAAGGPAVDGKVD